MKSLKSMPRLRFTNPEKSKIVILHLYGHSLKALVLKDLPSVTLELYPASIHITPTLIVRTLFRLRLIQWSMIIKKSDLKSVFRQVYAQYVLACIDQTEAKVVLTAIDNSRFFQNLTRIDHARTYFAIQNGTRTLACAQDSLSFLRSSLQSISMTNFFCFGRRDIDLFTRHGHKIDTYFPVGSLVGGYYKSQVSVPAASRRFDLCLVSQWHEHFFDKITGDTYAACEARRVRFGIEELNSFLLRLLAETNLVVVICTRTQHTMSHTSEVSFYKNTFGEKVEIAEIGADDFSSYRAIEQSRLAIALNSTMLAEVFSWGQKVLWCNVPNDDHFEMPEAGISYFHGDDYGAFKERVLTLLRMPQKDYEMLTREAARYINNYDTESLPHENIRSVILKSMGAIT